MTLGALLGVIFGSFLAWATAPEIDRATLVACLGASGTWTLFYCGLVFFRNWEEPSWCSFFYLNLTLQDWFLSHLCCKKIYIYIYIHRFRTPNSMPCTYPTL